MIKINKLTKKYLNAASRLANSVFHDEPILPGEAFEASLDRKKFEELFEKNKAEILSLEYFVAVDDKDKVLGTSGLYSQKKDSPEAYWLGWYCVDKKYRGLGIGGKLLDYTIEKARKRGKIFLRLYTSASDDERAAQRIYDAKGFRTTRKKKEKNRNYIVVYKELKL